MRCKLCGTQYDPEYGPECDCAERLAQWAEAERYKDEFREEYGRGEHDINRQSNREW